MQGIVSALPAVSSLGSSPGLSRLPSLYGFLPAERSAPKNPLTWPLLTPARWPGKKPLASDRSLAVNPGAMLERRAATIACRPIETSADPRVRALSIFLAAEVALVAVPGKEAAPANERYS